MPLKPGHAYVCDPRACLQEVDDRRSAARVGIHPQLQCPQSAMHEEAIERTRNGTDRVLNEPQLLVGLLVAGDHDSSDDVGVATEVLGGGMHDEVGTELERTLVGGGRERVVDCDQRVLAPRDDALDVDDVEQRVGRALDPDQPGVVASRRAPRRRGPSGRPGRTADPSG